MKNLLLKENLVWLESIRELKSINRIYDFMVANFGNSDSDGDTRYVWIMDSFVFKLAMSIKHIEDNKNEISVHKCLDDRFFAKILDYDKHNFLWITMEKVDTSFNGKVNAIRNLFKLDDLDDDSALLWFGKNLYNKEILNSKAVDSNSKKWIKGFFSSMQLCSVIINDLHEDNLGARNGRPVFFDYGKIELVEQNTLASGNVVGYMAPLGAKGIGTAKALEKGFWRNDAGKTVKTGSPALHKKKKVSLSEIIFKEMALSNDSLATEIGNKLKTLDNFYNIKQYAAQNYQKIGEGSSRIIYDLGNNLILKVIKSSSMSDNRDEIEYKKCLDNRFFTKIFDYDDRNFYWVISEKVQPINDMMILVSKLKQNLEGTMFLKKNKDEHPHAFFTNFRLYIKNSDDKKRLGKRDYLEMNSWLADFIQQLEKCDFRASDVHLANWGMRNNGDIVILDYAL